MRIGELAALAGVNVKTIRYYEDVRLMPLPKRSSSGYRDYEDDAPARLRFIKAAQSVGLTLGQIREVLAFRDRGETPCSHVVDLLERHAANLSDRIAALQAMQKDLERLTWRARRSEPSTEASYCHIIEVDARLRVWSEDGAHRALIN